MDFICNKDKCSGCRTCENVCPQEAIKMRENEKGFLYPVIYMPVCVNCGKCRRVCPSRSIPELKSPIKIFACKNKNVDDRTSSSSGGVFTELCKYIFEQGGSCFGAGFNKQNQVEHMKITSIDELYKIRTSKYVQSDMKDTYKEIKNELTNGKKVLLSGTPCQVQAIKNCKEIDENQMLYIDIVCHGVPSPKIFEEYKNYLEKKYNSKILNINFRYKTEETIKNMKIDFENGETYVSSYEDGDIFCKLFGDDIILRDSCYSCDYKSFERVGDISLGDFWGYDKGPAKEFGDNKGVSLVLINTEKGMKAFDEIKAGIDYLEITKDDCYPYNCFSNFKIPEGLDKIWEEYLKNGFEAFLNQ